MNLNDLNGYLEKARFPGSLVSGGGVVLVRYMSYQASYKTLSVFSLTFGSIVKSDLTRLNQLHQAL